MSRTASITGLAVAMAWPFVLPAFPGMRHADIADVRQDTILIAVEWAVTAVLFVVVLRWERLPLGSIGLRPPGRLDLGVASIVIAVYLVFALASRGHIPQMNIAALPLGLRVVLVLTAGFCEEVMFRGYAIERLTALTGRLWLGGFASFALFTLGHLPRFGLTPSLLAAGVITVMLTALYMWRRNLWLCVLLHGVVDAVAFLAVPRGA